MKPVKPQKKDIISQYKVNRKIGQGQFGIVYEVERKADKQRFALKVVNLSQNKAFDAKETVRESKILKQLNHPCIIKFIEAFITKKENQFNIITELATRGDLNDRISQYKTNKNKIEENLILDWCTQICLALVHIHRKKIIHRDLKPQNLFLSGHDLIKIGDFGISKSLFFANQMAQTLVGTPLYMAPEIIEGKMYQFQVDMWSLGVILYELMALSSPFYSNSIASIYTKIMMGKYPELEDFYSQDLREMVYSLLSIDPEKRPTPEQVLESDFIKNRIAKRLRDINYVPDFSQSIICLYVSYFFNYF